MNLREFLLRSHRRLRLFREGVTLFRLEARDAATEEESAYFLACAKHLYARYVKEANWRIG